MLALRLPGVTVGYYLIIFAFIAQCWGLTAKL